jgi:hypothetical protein
MTVDNYTSVDSAIYSRFIAERFGFGISNIDSTLENVDKLYAEIQKQYDVERYTIDISASEYAIAIMAKDESFLYYCTSTSAKDVSVSTYGKDFYICLKMFKEFKPYITKNEGVSVKFDQYNLTQNGIVTSTTYKELKDYENISKLYYPFLNTDEMFKQYLLSNDSLLVLGGLAGTGKTNIINLCIYYCMLNPELIGFEEDDEDDEDNAISVAYVKNIDILAMDEFWSNLVQHNYDFVVLDDIDYMLVSRDQADVSQDDAIRRKFISNLLSFTDGIFDNKTKFIITSNQDIGTIDTAILRKGRCFDILSFRPLHPKEAEAIWVEQGLERKDFEVEFRSYDSILACDVGSKIDLYKSMIDRGINHKQNYILEDGISLYGKIPDNKISL